MKIRLTTDELYPVYHKTEYNIGKEVEVPDELWGDYVIALGELYKCLDVLDELFDKA